MKKLALMLLLSPLLVVAQNTVTVTASHIYQQFPSVPLPAGTILFQATDANGKNISYQTGGTGPSFTAPTVCAITNGVITGPTCTLPNVSLSSPANFCFNTTVKNSANVVVLGGPGSGYQCVQPVPNSAWCTAGACNFDNFQPALPTTVLVINLPPPTLTQLGGVYSSLCAAGQAVAGYDLTGRAVCVASSGAGGGVWGTITGSLADQADLTAALNALAPLNSPALTGNPTAPMPLLTDSSYSVATTNWVKGMGYAPLFSPVLIGDPTAPTPATNDNSQSLATTAWVLAQGYSSGSGNVAGPGSSTDSAAVLWDGTNGRLIKNSAITFPLARTNIGAFVAGSNGFVASAFTDTTNASNIITGTLPGAQLPNPTSTTLGGIKATSAPLHQFVVGVATTGLIINAQPACGDLSNGAPSCSTDTTNASNVSSGTLNSARMGAGYPFNFLGNATGDMGTLVAPVFWGSNRAFMSFGDHGSSPQDLWTSTDNATSTGDLSSNIVYDSGPTSRHSSFSARIQGVQQIQTCWQAGPQGKVMIGNALTCPAENTTPFDKVTIATAGIFGSGGHSQLKLYTPNTSYTGTMHRFVNATAAGAGWKYMYGCAGASATDGSCAGQPLTWYLDGTGNFSIPAINGTPATSLVSTVQNNTYTNNTVQVFPVTGTTASLVVGMAGSDPCCSMQAGSVWINSNGLGAGLASLSFFDGNFPVHTLTDGSTPANMANGTTGTGPTVLANGASLNSPNIGNATGISLTLAQTTGDQMDLQPGLGQLVNGTLTSGTFVSNEAVLQGTSGASSTFTGIEPTGNLLLGGVTGTADATHTWVGQTSGAVFTPTSVPGIPYIQRIPLAGHIIGGYASDSTYKWSFNGDPLMTVRRTVATGTAVMTTSAITAGACGTTVTVVGTNIQSTDVVDFSYSSAPAANPGVLRVNPWATSGNANFEYCNPTASSVTPTATTIRWSVSR